jgi:uncharacterized protein
MIIPDNFDEFRLNAKKKRTENKKFLDKLKKKKQKEVSVLIETTHDEVFACTDCLKCANCCKTTGPLFTQKDIERIASHLRMKPGAFVEQYLRIDEDNDYVLQSVPCTFLGADNYCSIYEVRPKACREYPHTDTPDIAGFYTLTAKNVEICPAVFEIVERLKKVTL